MEMRKLSELKVKNPYLRLDSDVSDLEKSIQTVGMIAPLVITPDNTLLAGGRRYQALKNLGIEEAFVTILDRDEIEQELISIDENLVRKSLGKVEIEGHLRRAKELYENLHPEEYVEKLDIKEEKENSDDAQKEVKKERLPGEGFLLKVSEKTGFSPKQIHQAIGRDEKASDEVKNARRRGELSLSQTNEIIRLSSEDQTKALDHIKSRPVREIRQFVKLAKTKGVEKAIEESPEAPNAREFREVEATLKKLLRTLKRLEIEGISLSDLPEKSMSLFAEIQEKLGGQDSLDEDSHYQAVSTESNEEEVSYQ